MDVETDLRDEGTAVNLSKVQQFQGWARKIRPILHLLGKAPASFGPLAVKICEEENEQDPTFLSDPALNEKCCALHHDLLRKLEENEAKNLDRWSVIQGNWATLLAEKEVQLAYSAGDAGISGILEKLEEQLALMKKERTQRIEMFIGELRKEIAAIWEHCMISDEEKAEFTDFKRTDYSEDLLNVHQEELQKWQIYHKKNEEILTKLTKREEMWKKLRELEAKAEDPNRFVNRGGALLKDQNMHNSIMKNLPKLESELIDLAANFEAEYGKKMKVFGKEIPFLIDENWKAFKEHKASKKLIRQSSSQSINELGVNANTKKPPKGPLKAVRKSVMPKSTQPLLQIPPASATCRPGEKRPGSRLNSQTPLKSSRLAASLDSSQGSSSDSSSKSNII